MSGFYRKYYIHVLEDMTTNTAQIEDTKSIALLF